MADELVAARHDTTRGFSGIPIAEDIDQLVTGFHRGSWIDSTIGGVASSLDALVFVTDPLGQLVSWGVGWLIEHVKPLSDALDTLAGDPDQITAYAATWRNVAHRASSERAALDHAVATETRTWTGPAGSAYRSAARSHGETLDALNSAATALAEITTGVGLLVAAVRTFVRDLIADFVSVLAVRLWEWLAEAGLTLGLASPWVITQVTTLASKWITRIASLLHALTASLRRLTPLVRRLEDLIANLRQLLRRGGRAAPPTPPTPRRPPSADPAKTAELGAKTQFFLGNATGNPHNIQRSRSMEVELHKIGIRDDPAGHALLNQHFRRVYDDPTSVVGKQDNGRMVREGLLAGPLGFLKTETVWEGNRLITGFLYRSE
ncbi:WXG100 family type VII secretion target [Cryptosporangium sp. NPDC051539]|uniref:WXG100-like domain-containing protein n=1 Tax=Cryptosporangium sp. NPDC051539 TaxID=3363962 RepID=UPI003794D73B